MRELLDRQFEMPLWIQQLRFPVVLAAMTVIMWAIIWANDVQAAADALAAVNSRPLESFQFASMEYGE
jgi:hypothetical protein